jgi:hypothetical protein
LQYQQDISNFSTTHNVAVMIGEQKHKIFKAHAPHTNSRDTALQLLKAINTSQTVRFMLDGVYPDHPLSAQLIRIADTCPTLLHFFLGASRSYEPDNGNAYTDNSCFVRVRACCAISSRKTISGHVRSLDAVASQHAYQRLYGVHITQSMRPKFEYFQKITCELNQNHHVRKMSFPVGGFLVDIHSKEFYHILRILSMRIGPGQHRLFLVVQRLRRNESEECFMAPYDVFCNEDDDHIEVKGLPDLEPMNIHMVRKTASSWWYNSFVTNFL